jgi:DNA-binding HxlR family transcriptional regulator
MSLELIGDRWSLLIIRDMMVRGYRTFGEFLHSGEGIATNILSNRLKRLEAGGILSAVPAQEDGRSTHYRLTEKGISLAPVMLELLIWGAHHQETVAPCAVIDEMEQNREAVLKETYRRWKERDPTPILPAFEAQEGSTNPNSPKGNPTR